jgi:hypothetical protein
MIKNIAAFLCLLNSSIAVSQNHSFAQRLDVELGSFYKRELDDNRNLMFSELSFSSSFNVNLNNFFSLGLRTYLVRAESLVLPRFKSWHTLMGPSLKLQVVFDSRIEFDFEGAYLFGNYCPDCTSNDEFYNASLHYASLLMHVHFQAFRSVPRLWLTGSFAVNIVLNDNRNAGYNLPLFGLKYRIGNLQPRRQ